MKGPGVSLGTLFVIAALLKLAGKLTISWWWVCSPLFVAGALWVFLTIFVTAVAIGMGMAIKRW